MKISNLMPVDNRKSFYGKAKVIEDNNEMLCQSYDTIVCKVDANGNFVRLWGGYSATTMRHINAFMQYAGIPGGGKAWWDKQPIQG